MFVAQGFISAIVQRKDLEPPHLDSVFWIIMAVSTALTLASLAFGGLWAGLCGIPQLAQVIGVLSISIPLRGLTVVQEAVLSREMNFKSLAFRTNLSVIGGGLVGVAMAFAGMGVWALVGQHLVKSVLAVAILWQQSSWRPSTRFSRHHAVDLLAFSMKSFPATLLEFGGRQAETFIMGLYFGPQAVGLYRFANRLVETATTLVTRALWFVAFPYFSRSQEDREELTRKVLWCIRLAAAFTMPVLACLVVVSDPFLAVIGPEWANAGDVLKILCIYGAVKCLTLFMGPVTYAVSKPQILSGFMAVYCVLICAVCFGIGIVFREAGDYWQVTAMAWARAGVMLVLYLPAAVFFMMRYTGASLARFAWVAAPATAAAAVGICSAYGLGLVEEVKGLPPLVLVPGYGTLAGTVAVAVLLILDRKVRETTFETTSNFVRFIRRRAVSS